MGWVEHSNSICGPSTNTISTVSYLPSPAPYSSADSFAVTDTDSPLRVSLLAAHLYYRALRLVPGLVRDWLRDCRDRQLNSTVSSYTSTHFSPVIVSTELAQLKSADAADLADENMTVKVASAVNEVTAAYTVDEYTLELKLRLPNDWPLRPAEVTDTAPVGVKEDRWKSWVLGVQQILTFRVRVVHSVLLRVCFLLTKVDRVEASPMASRSSRRISLRTLRARRSVLSAIRGSRVTSSRQEGCLCDGL